ncbi:hypothetical protein MIMGU_mgv1a005739mg [Erythranthe guttata]|uniref:Uncharacterized protein n=1 Tax=Erythranthe guttata TaxID=4155 RepID=A0A022QBQ8_ERYGU|nr:hypothetical protein MIMGU_mgv1a005739mg [Erythranthe guttata]
MLEHCKIQPSPCSDDQELSLSLPLTHFDIPFLLSDPTVRLIFFNSPTCSKSRFVETIVPQLKKSLATTLTHFLPLAGKIIIPGAGTTPLSRYVPGDSVSLTIAQCDKDFEHLTGNHQRSANEFYACVPHLPPARRMSDDSLVFSVLALQITLFPEKGICVGLSNYHVVADESSIISFLKIWAVVNKSSSSIDLLTIADVPDFDRTTLVVRDPGGKLVSRAMEIVKKNSRGNSAVELSSTTTFPIKTNRVRVTLVLTDTVIEKMKTYVSVNRPNLSHVSSFTVICAYIWSCSVKSEAAVGEKTDENEPVCFTTAADCRPRLVPPLPAAYFGNCVVFVIAESMHGLLLKGNNEGFLIAAESIGKAVRETLDTSDNDGILDSADWPVDFARFDGKRVMSVAGSPRFDVYEVDFGWGGRAKKYEFAHLDTEKSMSLCKSREFDGGFEIGLSRTKLEMDAFQAFFRQGLEIIMRVSA